MNSNFKNTFLKENWVNDVKPKWKPPENTFSKDTPIEKTVEIVGKASKDLKQAILRVNFYFNRCGDKCSEERRKKIIEGLRKYFLKKETLKIILNKDNIDEKMNMFTPVIKYFKNLEIDVVTLIKKTVNFLNEIFDEKDSKTISNEDLKDIKNEIKEKLTKEIDKEKDPIIKKALKVSFVAFILTFIEELIKSKLK